MTNGTTSTLPQRVTRPFATTPADHRFFSAMSMVTALTIAAGFSSTYLPKVVTGSPPVVPIVHLHAVVFVSWLVLFVIQTTLVASGRTALHRRLGIAGIVLALLMFIVGTAAAITVARAGHRGIPGVEFPDAGGFLLLNLASISAFAILVAAAWSVRRNVQAHKRLMLTATAGALTGPGVSRLPFASGNPPLIGMLVLAFLVAGPVYDLVTRRRVHKAYLWGGLIALSAIPPVVGAVAATDVWHRIAAALLR